MNSPQVPRDESSLLSAHQCTRGKTQQISTRGIQKITERIRTRCKTTNMPLQMSTRSGGGDGIKTRIKSGRLKRSTYGKEVVYSIMPQTTKAKAIPKKKNKTTNKKRQSPKTASEKRKQFRSTSKNLTASTPIEPTKKTEEDGEKLTVLEEGGDALGVTVPGILFTGTPEQLFGGTSDSPPDLYDQVSTSLTNLDVRGIRYKKR
jgi:hypothetical protein